MSWFSLGVYQDDDVALAGVTSLFVMAAESSYEPLADDVIHAAWQRHFADLANAGDVFERLLHVYREPHRRYHTIEHALEVADAAESLSGALTVPETQAVLLAAWTHDAFYEVGSSTNEARSADLAAELGQTLGFQSDQIASVRDLILVSTHRVTPQNRPQMILCDADLSGLAKPWHAYCDDVENIRHELQISSLEEWQNIRHMIIGFFQTKEPLFYLDESVVLWDAAARANFAKEKDLLPQP